MDPLLAHIALDVHPVISTLPAAKACYFHPDCSNLPPKVPLNADIILLSGAKVLILFHNSIYARLYSMHLVNCGPPGISSYDGAELVSRCYCVPKRFGCLQPFFDRTLTHKKVPGRTRGRGKTTSVLANVTSPRPRTTVPRFGITVEHIFTPVAGILPRAMRSAIQAALHRYQYIPRYPAPTGEEPGLN